MNKYKKHFLLDSKEIISYVKEKKLFSDENELIAEEIGDGNINYVFRVKDIKTGKSVVLKQADTLLRSSGRPLDIGRSKIEAKILGIEGKLAKKFVPEVHFYDDTMAVLAMEDISEYKNLRKELIEGNIFPNFSEEISTFLANTLFLTTDLVLPQEKKKLYVKEFINPDLCDISECLVFTEPYTDDKKRNVITSGNESFVETFLYQNFPLHFAVAKLKENFMNSSQALIHGDLHSGSIFISSQGIKIIDPEFAFYGPMAYDVGNVIANLQFPYFRAKYFMEEGERKRKFLVWWENCIQEIPKLFLKKLQLLWTEKVKDPIRKNEKYKEYYMERLSREIAGYTGTEMIRRVVGDAKVLELTSLEVSETKLLLERELLQKGISLILENTTLPKEDIFLDAREQNEIK